MYEHRAYVRRQCESGSQRQHSYRFFLFRRCRWAFPRLPCCCFSCSLLLRRCSLVPIFCIFAHRFANNLSNMNPLNIHVMWTYANDVVRNAKFYCSPRLSRRPEIIFPFHSFFQSFPSSLRCDVYRAFASRQCLRACCVASHRLCRATRETLQCTLLSLGFFPRRVHNLTTTTAFGIELTCGAQRRKYCI